MVCKYQTQDKEQKVKVVGWGGVHAWKLTVENMSKQFSEIKADGTHASNKKNKPISIIILNRNTCINQEDYTNYNDENEFTTSIRNMIL